MANKLTFKKIRAKNFRSIGNAFLEIDYQAYATTLIASKDNGSGKSTLAIWALYFALFGKPYKAGVKIGSLVNSKSNKDCLVEVDFETAGSQWMVRRGYKPGIFEIYQDGKLIENEAALADTQGYLQSIICMDDKAFSNIVALGVDRFVPFVQMTAPERRSFVEQMLDLIVISGMNTLTKEKVKILKKNLDQINYDIAMLESRRDGRMRTVKILEDKKQQRLNESGSELDAHQAEVNKINVMTQKALEKLKAVYDEYVDSGLVPDKLAEVKGMIQRFKVKQSDIRKSAQNVADLHDCPTCKQSVTEAHKTLIVSEAEAGAEKLNEPLRKLDGELLKAQAAMDRYQELKAENDKISSIKNALVSKRDGIEMLIKQIKSKMVDSNEDALIDAEQDEIIKIQTELWDKSNDLNEEKKNEAKHLQLLQVLKDDGIKASIVAQYLPFLNQTINKLLDQMNLYVQINIDSEFNVVMFAPDRKGQTIENLSTGQCRRIDLAVLIAWREIAKNKASVDCNILVLDEILENLSASGVEEFMEMWETIGVETNLIVISQRASEFSQYFDREINYKLLNDLTVEC